MATPVGNRLIGGMIENPPVERDMDMADAGEVNGMADQRSGKTTCMSFMVASEQWQGNENGRRLSNEPLVPVSAPGDRRSQME